MRQMNLLLLLLVASSSCFCQEKVKVDLDGPAMKTEPKATTGKVLGAIKVSGGDNTPRNPISRNPIWRVELSAYATPVPGSTTLEIHIVNVSAAPRAFPLSQDGIKHASGCQDHTVLEGALFLGGKADNKYLRQLGILYGCEKLPATHVQLKPGEWATFVTTAPTGGLPNEIRAQFRLVHKKYRPVASGQTRGRPGARHRRVFFVGASPFGANRGT